jgi:cytoskeleton protein RodZ
MPNIGDTLREARMRQHLDIADVESRTKIRAKYLRALENEEFGMLPGPTFVKTFLRTYAEALGLDPQVLVEEYRATYESREDAEQLQPLGPSAVARDRRRGPRPPRGPWVAIGLAVVLVVGALLLIGLVGGDDEGGGGEGGSEQAGDEPTTGTTETTKPEPEKPAQPRRVTLRITPNNPVYVCLDTGADTDVTFEGILDAPRTFRGRRLRVNLGKTDVQVTVNGKPVQIEPGPEPVGFAFTPRAQQPLPAGQRPCA